MATADNDHTQSRLEMHTLVTSGANFSSDAGFVSVASKCMVAEQEGGEQPSPAIQVLLGIRQLGPTSALSRKKQMSPCQNST